MKTQLTSPKPPVQECDSLCAALTLIGLFTHSSQVNAHVLRWIGVMQLCLLWAAAPVNLLKQSLHEASWHRCGYGHGNLELSMCCQGLCSLC